MITVGVCTEITVNEGYEVMHHHLIERGTILAESLTVAATPERSLDITALHNDNHRYGFAAGNEIIHDMLHVALTAPSCLVLTHTVLQVKYGIAFFAFLVRCRCINHGMTPLIGRLGVIGDTAYLSVCHSLLWTVVITFRPLGYLNTSRLTVAAKESLGSRIDDIDSADIDEIIVEAHH